MNYLLLLWFHMFLFVFWSSPTTIAAQSNSDEESLIAIKNSITLDPLNVFSSWVPTIHFCNWTGVTCDAAARRVESLSLESAQLQGSVSPSIGNLSFLTELYLYNNSLSGEIPQELGRLRRLQMLYLSVNQLQGPIPVNLTACQDLVQLSLASNHLTGSIPTQVSLLTKLQVLLLGSNNLTGTIPSFLANLSSLYRLSLVSNNLQGLIPPELGQINGLQSLFISDNHLSGPVPSSLSNISALSELDLDSNSLSGGIPPELGKLAQLQVLYLWGNNLKGTIPTSLANCSQMVYLDLELNQLTGVVPSEFSKLSYLEFLSLSSNQFVSGSSATIPILSALANCTQLNELYFHDNYLTGHLPEQLPTNLSLLLLNGNNITGHIPLQIGNLTNLTQLDLSFNLFTGQIPSLLRKLGKLQRLRLNNNKLEGSIPNEIGEIVELGELSMSHNMLSGVIPDTIAQLQQLRRLMLHYNLLSGNISASLGQCYKLELLDLSYNQFTGHLPPEVASLPNLQFYFNLSRNSLQGQLPLEIGKMIHVQAIDVSLNRLEGQIPGTLGSCEQLQHLNLSSNSIQGRIPNSLGDLKSLVDIDLSFNNLSGPIPMPMRNLNMLKYMNLSFNNLSGEIPEDGVFKNFTAASFMGNSFLCGEWIHLPSCPIVITSAKNHSNDALKIGLAVGAVGIVFCFVLIGGLIYWRHRLHMQKMNPGVYKDASTINIISHMGISYQEIVKATDGFHEENLLGTGSFGSVYKGILNNDVVAAFKLLSMQNGKASRSFNAECKVLGNARHRNLVNLITFCSEIDKRVLVLQFMSRGNLEKLLFSDGGSLGLGEILSIAIDVAHGLEYLHHDCSVQFVHCDIKPSNILLDEDMTAHVADFGIAQLVCDPDSIESLTSTLSLKGSIGYIPPEYGMSGNISTKGDVYSYGIVLLEMITGKSPTNDMFMGESNLHKWVSMHFPGRVEEIVDQRVMREIEEYEIHEVLIPFIHIGLVCSNESPIERPTMQEVAGALETMRKILLPSTKTTKLQTYM